MFYTRKFEKNNGKLIKSISIFFLFLLFLTIFSMTASAVESDYHLDELGLSISMPSDMAVFTRTNLSEMQTVLDEYGLNANDLLKMMKNRSTYLDAINLSSKDEIYITMAPSVANDFNMYTDKELMEISSGFSTELEKIGINFDKYSIYHQNQTKYIKIYCSKNESGTYVKMMQYSTVCDHMSISITYRVISPVMIFDDVVFSDEDEKYLTRVIESIKLDNVSLPEPEATDVESDSDLKSSSYKPDIENNIFICVIFTLILYSLPLIIYRYAIKKHPIETHLGRIISLFWGLGSFVFVCAFIVLTDEGLIATACSSLILLFINYIILTKGYNDISEAENYPFYDSTELPIQRNVTDSFAATDRTENVESNIMLNASDETASKANNIVENSDSDKITCPNCGKEFPGKCKYCSQCGTLLK